VTFTNLSDLWHRVIGTQPDPPRNLVIAVGVIALLAVLWTPVWRVARNMVTIAHEGGHAVVALMSGRKLAGVRLHSDTSGVTLSYGKPRGLGMVLTASAGYLTPSLLGLGGAWLLAAHHVTGMLWASIALLVLLLLLIRNLYGALSVIVTGALIFAVSWTATAEVQACFAYLAVSFLLLAGVKPIVELQHRRSRGRARDSDADQLARLTKVPGILWVLFFALVNLACLAAGARWLFHL
jgi:Peptidase M50B-like